MLSTRLILFFSLLTLVMSDLIEAADANKPKPPPPDQKLIYRPPILGTPSPRILVGGGTRSVEEDSESTSNAAVARLAVVLAPEQAKLTAKTEPTFFWWTDQPSAAILKITANTQLASVKFSVTNASAEAGVPHSLGVGRLSLSEQGFQLKQGVEYRWTVSLVGSGSGFPPSGGIVRYQKPSAKLQEKLGRADRESRAQLYASEGYWYDAIELLWEWIAAHPETSQNEREALVNLLEQAGLELPGFKDQLLALKASSLSVTKNE